MLTDRAGPSSSIDGRPLHALDVEEALAALGSSPRGLAGTEAASRRARVGPNELPPPPRRPLVLRFLAGFTDLFAVVLIVAAGITLLAYAVQRPHEAGNLQLTVAILCVVLLNATIGFLQEYSAERTADALTAMVPKTARVIREGQRTEVPARELVPGDLVVLEAGDVVSCDARVVEAHDLAMNMMALTGESDPVARTADPAAPDLPPIEARDLVFMGTSVAAGTGKAAVAATGLATEFGRIFRMTAEVREEPSPLQRQVAHMASRVAAAALVIGTLLFGVRASTGTGGLVESFVFALGVMVALVPEGLPATLSVSLAIGVRRMARRRALVKRLVAVETLGSTTVICTDKTGTLTKAEMTVQAVWTSGRRLAVAGVGYAPEGEVEDAAAAEPVLRTAALCSDARLLPPGPGAEGEWRVLGDTTEGAVLVAAAKAGIDPEAAVAAPRVAEFPFDPARKLMSTVVREPEGPRACVKGSPQELVGRCTRARWDGATVPMTDELRARIAEANDALAADALRVLAVATKPVTEAAAALGMEEVERDLELLGLIGMVDPPRPEVERAVRACRTAGIRVIMVTGDYGLTAEAIGRRVGIVRGRAHLVTGQDLEGMSDLDLKAALHAHWEIVFARVKPEHKMRVVAALKDMGEIVAVTGDGANDAPALRRADIGVAMGRSGTDVAREAGLMVLLDDSFATIVEAVERGRSIYENIRKFLVYLFSHNIAELTPILVAAVVGFPLVPLTALQVLSIDLGSDVLPALALGAEAPEPGIMERPPRHPAEHLMSAAVVGRFLFLGTIMSIGVVAAFFWRVHSAHLGFASFRASNPVYREALTMTQAGIVVGQFFNGFAVRTERASVFRVGLLSNRALLAGEVLGIGIVSAISYAPPLQRVFGTAPLSATDWLALLCIGLVLLAAEEARKALARHRAAPRGPAAGKED